jgi:hypothetical protein
MKRSKFAQFLALMSVTPSFRMSVIIYPLWIAVGGFLWYLLRGKTISESLFYSAVVLLFGCFIGLIGQAIKRGKLRW